MHIHGGKVKKLLKKKQYKFSIHIFINKISRLKTKHTSKRTWEPTVIGTRLPLTD